MNRRIWSLLQARPGGVRLKSFLTRLIWLCMAPPLLLAGCLAFADLRDLEAERDAEATQLAKALTTAADQNLAARVGALQMLAASPLADKPARWGELYHEAQGIHAASAAM